MSVIQFYLEDTETLVYCIDDPTKIRFGQIENTQVSLRLRGEWCWDENCPGRSETLNNLDQDDQDLLNESDISIIYLGRSMKYNKNKYGDSMIEEGI